MIPLSRPDITDLEREAVQQVLLTPNLALGPKLREFEEAMAAYHGRRRAVAVNSGTSALHLAMIALGVKPGDEVVTTPFSFVASTNCILFENGTPRFVDIDPDTWNIDTSKISEAINDRTKGILPVHVFGLPADMTAVRDIARGRGLWSVEDACEAIGAEDHGVIAGKNSDIAVLAFYPNKQITTGEGGMVLTDDDGLADMCLSVRNQGRAIKGGGWLSHERLGYNYRMSDIQAALGLAQLSRIDEILEKRARVAAWYDERLGGCSWLRFQTIPEGTRKSWFVYVVALAEERTQAERNAVLAGLRERDIQCNNYFTPIHLQPFMAERLGTKPGDFPMTESVAQRTIALPFFGNMTETLVDEVCKTLTEVVGNVIGERVGG